MIKEDEVRFHMVKNEEKIILFEADSYFLNIFYAIRIEFFPIIGSSRLDQFAYNRINKEFNIKGTVAKNNTSHRDRFLSEVAEGENWIGDLEEGQLALLFGDRD